MARASRSAAALAGKQANKQATSPYFEQMTGKSRGKAKATATPTKQKRSRTASASKQDSDGSSENFQSEQSDSSTEDSEDARDVYKEPDSDAIDEESDVMTDLEADDNVDSDSVVSEDIDGDVPKSSSKKKAQRSANSGSGKKKRKGKERESSTPSKKAKKRPDSDFEAEDGSDNDDEVSEEELEDGRKVVRTKLVKAPSSSVKPGLIDPHTMQFLSDLRAHNDREWFAKNDARYRHALRNWQNFVTEIQTEFQRGDWSIPEMPAKDLIHRIYRDIRFSNDKTPYKTNMAASFSRAGRKGPFAGYYLQVSPGGRSLLAGGKWTPDKNDLATIRTNIIRNSKPLRRVITAPKFVEMFGPAKPDAKGKGQRNNVFGAEDMLKVAPKMNGVDKSHKDIDLLKLRTIGVVHYFKDEDVVKPSFRSQVQEVVEAMSPLVLLLNDMLHPQSDAEEEVEDEGSDDEGAASEPDQDQKDRIEVTAASSKLCESAANDQEPVEENDSDAMEGEGGIEEV